MPDFIYLLENRLSAAQQHALRQLREVAREAEMILFLTGDAVRDLTSGHAVRDLEVTVHGNAHKLKKSIEKLGGEICGESEALRTVYTCFTGAVRVDVVSAHSIDYTNLNKPVVHLATIQEDLRRRDFTANAMAISLNEGSYGLLMDPLNGAADIEARALRLVSNYGFLEDPSNLIRATRYVARLGWELDPKTQTRFDNAREDGAIERLSTDAKARELEQIGHEDDGLKVLRALEAQGWMNVLFPVWTSAKVDEEKLKALHDLAVELLVQGIHPDMSAAQMQLLTAKLSSKDLAALKQQLLRPGFVKEWDSLDQRAAAFAKVLLSKDNATSSAGYKLFTSYDAEAVLWLGFTSKDKNVQERYNNFLKVWPEARQRIPHALMQELRITPELPAYGDIVHALFLELIDGKLTTPEELRAYLEPHSPPAPPPREVIKRPRAKRGEAKIKERSYEDEDEAEGGDDEEDLDDLGGDDEEIDLGIDIGKGDLEGDAEEEPEGESEESGDDGDDDDEPPPSKKKGKKEPEPKEPKKPKTPAAGGKAKVTAKAEPQPVAAAKHAVAQVKPAAVAPKAPAAPAKAAAKAAPEKAAPAKPAAKATAAAKSAPPTKPAKAVPTKPAPAAKAKPAPAKPAAKAAKLAPKPAKAAPPKGKTKPAKPAAKGAKKR